MSKRKTTEDYRELGRLRGLKYLGVEAPKDVFTKVPWECDDHGHQFLAIYNSISHMGSGCPFCAGNDRKTVEDMHILGARMGYKFKDTEYRGNGVKHLWGCIPDDHDFWSRPADIGQGKGCPKCAGRGQTVEDMYELWKRTGNVFKDTEYRGVDKKHFGECVRGGHEFWARPSHLKRGEGCPVCALEKRTKYKTPLDSKIAKMLRGRLNKAVRGGYKSGSAVFDLGCSIPFFRAYIESLWEPWMNWGNYGRAHKTYKRWQIDHIESLWKFDLSDREQLLRACHYTNLRPLLSTDNIKKG